uniref:DUF1471 domain-containing protein n=1 Tax=Parastrongyloides trichosuri TaxID=131310 RepID=A0A0N4ZVP0_PARTI
MNTKFLIIFLLAVFSTTVFSTCYLNSITIYVSLMGTESNRQYSYSGKMYKTIADVKKAVENANTGYQISSEEVTMNSMSHQPQLRFDLIRS